MESPNLPETPQEWGHLYASRFGLRVLPIRPNEKRPPMAAWQDAATTDPELIDKWWTKLYPDCGIGIATGAESGVFALDVDVAGDKLGAETLSALIAEHGPLPETPTVTTPSGGTHYYFRAPKGVAIRNDAGRRLGPGLDIRGEGGQVVAPPTKRGTQAYEWEISPLTCQIAKAPKWLIDLLTADYRQSAITPHDAPRYAETRSDTTSTISAESFSPADHFNETTSWAELLEADGWSLDHVKADGEQGWIRPGKDAREGISATVGHEGRDIIRVFTTSLDWLPEGAYSRFGYYARARFGGDERAAARAVYEATYEGANAVLNALPVVEVEQGKEDTVPDGDPLLGSGWKPVDLAEVLAEGYEPPRPTLLLRTDGEGLFYAGRVNALFGESGSGKSWIAMAACAQVLKDGGHVIYVDFEDHAGSVVVRMLALGVGKGALINRFHYINPNQGWNKIAEEELLGLIGETDTQLAVIDSTGEAMAIDLVDPNADDATARWFHRFPRRIAKAGPAVVLLDHMPKSTEAPKGFAIGSQRKRAAIDGAAYRVEVGVAPAKGIDGHLKLIVAKDRGGAYQHGHQVAKVDIKDKGGRTDVAIEPPSDGPPTFAMKVISEWLADQDEPVSLTTIRETVKYQDKKGKKVGFRNDLYGQAIRALVAGGFVSADERTQGARYTFVKAFTDELDLYLSGSESGNPSPRPHPSPMIGDESTDTPENPSPPPRGDGFGNGLVGDEDLTSSEPTRPHESEPLTIDFI